MKVKLFTHTDLDGIGCAVLAIKAFGVENVDIEYCNYSDINTAFEKFLNSGKRELYDMTFITDISINETLAKRIEEERLSAYLQLLDHHKTAEWLNEYGSWAYVNSYKDEVLGEDPNELTSGTNMFYSYLMVNEYLEYCEKTDAFVKNVTDYDTWKWHSDGNEIPKKLNDALFLLGRKRFLEDWGCKLTEDLDSFFERYSILLELNQERIDKYIKSKNYEVKPMKMLGYNCGIVFAEQYISELGNSLSEMNSELDFIVIVNSLQTLSFRTVREDVDVSEIARHFGGGGHKKAAGSDISDALRNKIFKLIIG